MCSYFYTVAFTQSHRFAHGKCVAGMESAGYICLINVRHESGIISYAFAKVAVDLHREVSKKKPVFPQARLFKIPVGLA
jgi:hypothetical protein